MDVLRDMKQLGTTIAILFLGAVNTVAAVGGDHPIAIDQYVPSNDGKFIAYTVSAGGSENSVLHIREIATAKDLPDVIARATVAQVSWLPDNASFVYTRLAELPSGAPPRAQFDHQRVYLHRLGNNPDTDRVVLDVDHLPFAFKAAQVWPSLVVTAGSNHVLAIISDGTGIDKAFFTSPLTEVEQGKPFIWKRVAQQSDGATEAVVQGDQVFLLTHKNAPRYRVVREDLRRPDFASANTLVPEKHGVLTGMAASSEALYVVMRNGAGMTLSRLPYAASTESAITLPFSGTIYPANEDAGALVADPQNPGPIFGLESWVHPIVWLHYDPKKNVVADTGIVPTFSRDLSGYDTIETTAESPDGTKVPLSILMKHGTRLDGR
jgi:prolyl oligopeptidase